jgi:hypothetical protein
MKTRDRGGGELVLIYLVWQPVLKDGPGLITRQLYPSHNKTKWFAAAVIGQIFTALSLTDWSLEIFKNIYILKCRHLRSLSHGPFNGKHRLALFGGCPSASCKHTNTVLGATSINSVIINLTSKLVLRLI